MQKPTVAAIGAAALFAVPAFAQTSTNGTTATNPTSTTSSTSTGTNGSSSATKMSQADMSKLQQKITSDLQNDGYKNVRVVPNSFLIHAENKSGEPVVMIINPDSVFAITDVAANGTNGSPNSAGRTGGSLGNSTTNPASNTPNATSK